MNHMSILKLAMSSVGVPLIFQVPSLGFESPCKFRLSHSRQLVILLAHAFQSDSLSNLLCLVCFDWIACSYTSIGLFYSFVLRQKTSALHSTPRKSFLAVCLLLYWCIVPSHPHFTVSTIACIALFYSSL